MATREELIPDVNQDLTGTCTAKLRQGKAKTITVPITALDTLHNCKKRSLFSLKISKVHQVPVDKAMNDNFCKTD